MVRRKGTSILAEKPTYQPYYQRRQLSNRRKQRLTTRSDDEMVFVSQVGTQQPITEWKLVTEMDKRVSKRFRRTEYWSLFEVKHNFSVIPDLMEFQTSIDNAYSEAMTPFLDRLNDEDLIGGYIEHQSLKTSIYLRPQKVKD